MINRSKEHIIDTKAIRTVIAQLDHNWLIRNLDERDYGIDLTLERFDNENPTGDFILLQIKGTDSSFSQNVKLSGFPVKTIKYSLLFNIPFFVVHVSNHSNKAFFVWLQKYAETRLPNTTSNWQNQKEVTIYFPQVNDLNENISKIIDIIDKDKSKKVGVKFLSSYESLIFHSKSILTRKQYGVGKYCSVVCWNIASMVSFLDRYTKNLIDFGDLDLNRLGHTYLEISETLKFDSEDVKFIDSQLIILEEIKRSFLGEDEYDVFAVGMTDYYPY